MNTTFNNAETGGTKSGSNAGAFGAAALFTTAGIAERYSISSRQVQKMVQAGIFPTVKIGARCLRFPVADCDAALDRFKVRNAEIGRKTRASITAEGRA